MKQYFCNPLNFTYQYQFNQKENGFSLNREAADPSMILFNGKYYLFPSMTRGFLVSDDMTEWKLCPLKNVPVYDYAPEDVYKRQAQGSFALSVTAWGQSP